jgi:hypothetical protein
MGDEEWFRQKELKKRKGAQRVLEFPLLFGICIKAGRG